VTGPELPPPEGLSATPLGPQVLVVDDEPHIGRIIRMRLEQDGFRVLLAEDGPEALRLLAAAPAIALVVLDLMLPGMTGAEILQRIRSDVRWASLPCIVLTAAGQEGPLRDVEALGASEIMTKPFSPRRLLARVRDHISAAATGARPPLD
jgi:two-component system alkaline phosphatase synthesis response regulator PhoP